VYVCENILLAVRVYDSVSLDVCACGSILFDVYASEFFFICRFVKVFYLVRLCVCVCESVLLDVCACETIFLCVRVRL